MVSVVIPTYNREATILRSIQSVLGQTYKDLECIVVDDGSSDNTQKIVENITDSRVRYEKLEKNSGACAARNKGIELARGEYIAFQDSDDQWVPQKIEIQIKKIIESGADVCLCKKRMKNEATGVTRISHPNIKEGFLSKKDLYNGVLSTQLLFAKSDVFKKVRFDEQVKKSQDYEWGIRASEYYSFYFIAKVLVDQYLYADSMTVKGWKNLQVEKEMCEYFYQKFAYRYKSDPKLQISLLRRKIEIEALSGENPVDECHLLFNLSRSNKDLLKYMAAKAKVLDKLYRWRKYRGDVAKFRGISTYGDY